MSEPSVVWRNEGVFLQWDSMQDALEWLTRQEGK